MIEDIILGGKTVKVICCIIFLYMLILGAAPLAGFCAAVTSTCPVGPTARALPFHFG